MPAERRKILILIHSLGGGGAERVTVNLASTWAEAGDQVVIATFDGDSNIAYTLPPGIRHLPLDIAGDSRSSLSALVENVARIRHLRRLFRREKPDIVIGMMTTAAVLLGLARNGRFLAIGAEHNHPPLLPMGRVWENLRYWSYGRLDAVTALTSEGRDWLLQNTRARHVAIAPNAIHMPLSGGEPILHPRHIVPSGHKLMLSVGRLEPQKGFDRLIDAFAVSRRPDWSLVILGEGGRRRELEVQISQAGLQRHVFLPGWAGNLADWYRVAEFYVLSSRFEGFGNVLVEAMAHGCPTVSVDCDTGPRDIITHDVNGLLIPQDDPEALSHALARMMDDTSLRKKYSANAPSVCATFSPERIDAIWQRLFHSKVKASSAQDAIHVEPLA